jgi:hypothetical protein
MESAKTAASPFRGTKCDHAADKLRQTHTMRLRTSGDRYLVPETGGGRAGAEPGVDGGPDPFANRVTLDPGSVGYCQLGPFVGVLTAHRNP